MSRLRRIARRLSRTRTAPEARIWSGVYASFEEVPRGTNIASKEWLDFLAADIANVRGGLWNDDFVAEHDQLRLLATALQTVRLLDYGGGVGQTYAYLRRVMPSRVTLDYELCELPNVAELARQIHRGDPHVRVTSTLDPPAMLPDVVFVKSVLQYVDDFTHVLRGLFALRARFVLLEKFSGVSAPSYVTAQLVPAGAIPYRFISFGDVFAIAEAAGYDRLVWRRLPRVYDQSSFPPELRMGQASTLVFGRRD